MFKGNMVALVTPMNADGSIDKSALKDLIEWQIQSGTTAIIAAGSTGESATLDADEQFELISFVVNEVNGRIPVIAGTGSNSTRTAVKLADSAKRAGASACLVVAPYYNRPTQQGLYEHYKAIAESTTLPIILYNVPTRTACDILPETVEKLAKINNIIGIKDATGKLERSQEMAKRCGKDFEIYSGDDPTALTLMLEGGACGVISITTNIAPAKMSALCEAALEGRIEEAKSINAELDLLHKNLCIVANPIPIKWALSTLGKIQTNLRLPLLPLDAQYHQEVKKAMQLAGVV